MYAPDIAVLALFQTRCTHAAERKRANECRHCVEELLQDMQVQAHAEAHAAAQKALGETVADLTRQMCFACRGAIIVDMGLD